MISEYLRLPCIDGAPWQWSQRCREDSLRVTDENQMMMIDEKFNSKTTNQL